MLNFKRYFAIIAISFVVFSCQNVRERFTPTPLEPYVSKLSVKINGEAIANATAITTSVMVGTDAAGNPTDVLIIKGTSLNSFLHNAKITVIVTSNHPCCVPSSQSSRIK